MKRVQTKREIAAQLESAGVRPQKRLGQNFLIDGNLMRRLADSAELDLNDVVLEVGAGTGGLTDLLADSVNQLLVVEIDPVLFGLLEDRFEDRTNVTLLHGDVLHGKHKLLPALDSLLRSKEFDGQRRVKLVANLPYQIATPLVMNLLLDYPSVRRLCFTVQAELGERITSPPGCKSYGPLSILSQTLCKITVVSKIPASAFWPAPSVESVMLRMDVGNSPFASGEELRSFSRLVRGTFEHRRKTLRAALGYVLESDQVKAICRSVDAVRRPESFHREEWIDIHRLVHTKSAD